MQFPSQDNTYIYLPFAIAECQTLSDKISGIAYL